MAGITRLRYYTGVSPYDIRGWDTGDDNLDMSLRVNDKFIVISVSLSLLFNSHSALVEFSIILHLLAAGDDAAEGVWECDKRIADLFVPNSRDWYLPTRSIDFMLNDDSSFRHASPMSDAEEHEDDL
ncbi:hypothetical protein F5B20DRAFT_585514 [Whalleya microplaca]|nr:hypothetical protein F5B20DRAFT_585514 [Whalleya microplaca]